MRNAIFLIPVIFMAWQPLVRHTNGYMPNPVPVARHKFTVIAHRGDHVSAPENTLASYAQAIKDGVDYVEIDLRTTKDGQLVSLHNENVGRMTDGTGLIKDMLLKDIEKLKIKTTGQQQNLSIPTFRQILELCKNRIYIYIDFKEADPAVVYPILQQYGMEKQVLVYINKPEQFTAWRQTAPKMPLMVSLPDGAKDRVAMVQFINQYKPDVLDGDFKQYDTQLVAIAKSYHIPVWPDGQSRSEGPAIWDEVLKKGLAGLQTDHPQDFISYLEKKGIR